MTSDEFKFIQDEPPVMLARISPGAVRFTIYDEDGSVIVEVHSNGKVELNPKYTVDEAALAFWKSVEKIAFERAVPAEQLRWDSP